MNLAFDIRPDEWDGKVDGDIIAQAFIEVTPEEAALYKEHFFPTAQHGISTVDGQTHYLCRHWDEDTRLCRIHGAKPEVCRDYPYDKPCDYCGFEETPDVIADWASRERVHAN